MREDVSEVEPLNYDLRRISAPLVTCAICGLSYYMTKPSRICVPCRLEHLDPYRRE